MSFGDEVFFFVVVAALFAPSAWPCGQVSPTSNHHDVTFVESSRTDMDDDVVDVTSFPALDVL